MAGQSRCLGTPAPLPPAGSQPAFPSRSRIRSGPAPPRSGPRRRCVSSTPKIRRRSSAFVMVSRTGRPRSARPMRSTSSPPMPGSSSRPRRRRRSSTFPSERWSTPADRARRRRPTKLRPSRLRRRSPRRRSPTKARPQPTPGGMPPSTRPWRLNAPSLPSSVPTSTRKKSSWSSTRGSIRPSPT